MGHDLSTSSRRPLGKELAPYRVEWRPDLTCNWVLLRHVDTHEEALAALDAELKQHKGQVRAVTQHVIEVRGLGA